MSLLSLQNIHVSYGPVTALRGISIDVEEGEIVALLGANGAGKTTTLRAISRSVRLAAGQMHYDGQDITRLKTHQIVSAGIAHVPEGRRIFPDLTILENLDMGAYGLKDKAAYTKNLAWVYDLFPILADRTTQKGGTLSGGEQQMLAVGRALMSSPRVLMLDEPSLGLAPLIVEKIFHIITQINEEANVTVFLVEQNANEALLHAHRAYILETGTLTIQGKAADLRNDPKVKEAYLGG